MCGRTTSTTRRDTLARLLDVDEVDAPELPISWNVAPTQRVYAAATSSGGARKLRAPSDDAQVPVLSGQLGNGPVRLGGGHLDGATFGTRDLGALGVVGSLSVLQVPGGRSEGERSIVGLRNRAKDQPRLALWKARTIGSETLERRSLLRDDDGKD